MSFLTGKPATSTSSNTAAPWINQTYQPLAQTGISATNQLASLYGLGGDPAATQAAYEQFRNSAGYQQVLKDAMTGVNGSFASRGLFGSGAALKALQDRAVGIGQQYMGQYQSGLQNLASGGLSAGGLVAGAGQQSTSTGQTQGLLGTIGQGLGVAAQGAALFSDERLKQDVVKLGELDDGLGVYEYSYVFAPVIRFVGVLAQEVASLRPWALGPRRGGFMTVHYGSL